MGRGPPVQTCLRFYTFFLHYPLYLIFSWYNSYGTVSITVIMCVQIVSESSYVTIKKAHHQNSNIFYFRVSIYLGSPYICICLSLPLTFFSQLYALSVPSPFPCSPSGGCCLWAVRFAVGHFSLCPPLSSSCSLPLLQSISLFPQPCLPS